MMSSAIGVMSSIISVMGLATHPFLMERRRPCGKPAPPSRVFLSLWLLTPRREASVIQLAGPAESPHAILSLWRLSELCLPVSASACSFEDCMPQQEITPRSRFKGGKRGPNGKEGRVGSHLLLEHMHRHRLEVQVGGYVMTA